MPNESVNYWKFATIGIVLIGATVAATLLVRAEIQKPARLTPKRPKPARRLKEQKRRAFPLRQPGKPPPPAPSQRSALTPTSPAQQERFERPPSRRHIRRKRPIPLNRRIPSILRNPSWKRAIRYANERVSSKTEEVLKNAHWVLPLARPWAPREVPLQVVEAAPEKAPR